MWDLFGFKKRAAEKARRKEIEEREQMRLSEYRFSLIKKEFQILKERADKIVEEKDNRNRKEVEETNSICPKCKSKNVNDRIQRLQGEFKGSGSLSGMGILGSGYVSGSSHSSGKIDTNEINKCNDCGNEWKKAERKWNYQSKVLKDQFSHLRYILDKYKEAFTAEIDKNDLNEKFASDDEKREYLLNEIETGWLSWKKDVQEFFKGVSIETIKEVAEKEAFKYDGWEAEWFWKLWNERVLEERLGFKHLEIK